MKDTVIKGDGTSRTLKAPASMPETFEEWRSQLLAGNATMDIGLNSDGCTVVGTAMSKANLLSNHESRVNCCMSRIRLLHGTSLFDLTNAAYLSKMDSSNFPLTSKVGTPSTLLSS